MLKTPLHQVLATRLREARLAKSWTQEQLASEAKLTNQRVSAYETGRIAPDLDSVLKLATALEVSVDYLVEGAA